MSEHGTDAGNTAPLPFAESGEAIPIVEGMVLLRGCADEVALACALEQIVRIAPPHHMQTPRGFTMSVAMTSCGPLGWVSDRRGYRYASVNPQTDHAWPPMPEAFQSLAENAASAAGYEGFKPDACLINHYLPGSQMGAHQDKDEVDFTQPIVSVSLGLPVRFFVLGLERRGQSLPVDLVSGDVLVFGGPARLRYHGVRKLKDGVHSRFGACRWNLTFRRAR